MAKNEVEIFVNSSDKTKIVDNGWPVQDCEAGVQINLPGLKKAIFVVVDGDQPRVEIWKLKKNGDLSPKGGIVTVAVEPA